MQKSVSERICMPAPSFPSRVEIELSSACNLHCTYCPRQYLPPLGQYLDMTLWEKLLAELTLHPDTILTLHRRGESLLHPQLEAIMDGVAGRFAEVQLATNGTLLTEEKYASLVRGLTFLSFSLDTPERFNATRRGADYAAVERNILGFLEYNKGQVRTQVSMVRTDDVLDEQYQAFIDIWQPRVDRVRVYEEHSRDGVFGAMRERRSPRQPCTMPFYEILVYADGSVGRCNHDWDGPRLGDLNTHNIASIWHGPQLTELRRQHQSLNITDPVCKGCDAWYPFMGIQNTGKVVER